MSYSFDVFLDVQRALINKETTLEELEKELSIKSSYSKDGLVNLNYSMIDSPKTHPWVRECRSLIMCSFTFEIISMTFERFFNHGEALELTEDFDIENSYAVEKIDGSLMHLFYHEDTDEWRISTRSVIDGDTPTPFGGQNFKDVFDSILINKHLLDKDLVYIFEIVSPYNRVVTRYNKPDLYLIGIRDKTKGFREEKLCHVEYMAKALGVNSPGYFDLSSIKDVLRSIEYLPPEHEGFVLIEKKLREGEISFKRLKMKNPTYLALSKLKENNGASLTGVMGLVLLGKEKGFLDIFPEYSDFVEEVSEAFGEYSSLLKKDIERLSYFLDMERTSETRKQFAIQANSCKDPAFMFAWYEGKTSGFKEYFEKIAEQKSIKHISKKMLKKLNIENKKIL